VLGYSEDYAWLAAGLTDLYEATGDATWLGHAIELARAMPGLFGERGSGLLYVTGTDAEQLIARPVDTHDGAIPSANAAAALACLRLGRLTGDSDIEDMGQGIVRGMADLLRAQGAGYTGMLQALDLVANGMREIVVAGEWDGADATALRSEVDRRFLPDAVLVLHWSGERGAGIRTLAGYVAAQGPQRGRATAYVCRGHACQAPVTEPAALAAALDGQ
jgi:uncharacterized protein YyaL (SSP411 family)